MSDFTPSLDQVRGRYCDGTLVQTGHVTDGHEFDRAIAKVRAEAKAEALREAADELEANPVKGDTIFTRLILPTCNTFAALHLRARADKLDAL